MSMKEFVETGGSVLLIVLTLVQAAPIRSTWSNVEAIGKALNADLNEKMDANEAKLPGIASSGLMMKYVIRHGIQKNISIRLSKMLIFHEHACQDHPRFPNGNGILRQTM